MKSEQKNMNKLTITIGAFILVLTLGCSSEPAPNIEATVEARVAEALVPTSTPIPTRRPVEPTPYSMSAEQYVQVARTQTNMGNYYKAIESAEAGIALSNPRNCSSIGNTCWAYAVGFIELALAYSKLGDYEKSIEFYTASLVLPAAIFQNSDEIRATQYNARGYDYLQLDLYKQAIEDFNTALELDPDTPSAQANLQFAQTKLAETDDAPKGNNELTFETHIFPFTSGNDAGLTQSFQVQYCPILDRNGDTIVNFSDVSISLANPLDWLEDSNTQLQAYMVDSTKGLVIVQATKIESQDLPVEFDIIYDGGESDC